MGPVLQYVNAMGPDRIRVYPAVTPASLYEDGGDSYAYERGQRATVLLRWDDAKRQLQAGGRARDGSFPALLTAPTSGPPDAGHREIQTRATRTVTYRGQAPDTAVPLKARRTTHKHFPGDNSCASPSHPVGPLARAARVVRLRRPLVISRKSAPSEWRTANTASVESAAKGSRHHAEVRRTRRKRENQVKAIPQLHRPEG